MEAEYRFQSMKVREKRDERAKQVMRWQLRRMTTACRPVILETIPAADALKLCMRETLLNSAVAIRDCALGLENFQNCRKTIRFRCHQWFP